MKRERVRIDGIRRLRRRRLWHEGLALGEGSDVGGAAFLFSLATY